VLLLPRERLTPIEADSVLVMSFVMTGGVANAEVQPASSPALAPPDDAIAGMRAAEGIRAS